ncbi:hypothetical protein [Rhodococcus erythropolis]|uniref:hypothetical protein n=1 Tax=Rhodococcus erythropolis TaxID=1833 RepID=UPI0022B303C3|nr:hypothetical protein [Rhodococcus erythropolis]MCZ4567246.1 hypothetical protein [Rhodococcus erythropolis]
MKVILALIALLLLVVFITNYWVWILAVLVGVPIAVGVMWAVGYLVVMFLKIGLYARVTWKHAHINRRERFGCQRRYSECAVHVRR